jgi:hypothetical protein
MASAALTVAAPAKVAAAGVPCPLGAGTGNYSSFSHTFGYSGTVNGTSWAVTLNLWGAGCYNGTMTFQVSGQHQITVGTRTNVSTWYLLTDGQRGGGYQTYVEIWGAAHVTMATSPVVGYDMEPRIRLYPDGSWGYSNSCSVLSGYPTGYPCRMS